MIFENADFLYPASWVIFFHKIQKLKIRIFENVKNRKLGKSV